MALPDHRKVIVDFIRANKLVLLVCRDERHEYLVSYVKQLLSCVDDGATLVDGTQVAYDTLRWVSIAKPASDRVYTLLLNWSDFADLRKEAPDRLFNFFELFRRVIVRCDRVMPKIPQIPQFSLFERRGETVFAVGDALAPPSFFEDKHNPTQCTRFSAFEHPGNRTQSLAAYLTTLAGDEHVLPVLCVAKTDDMPVEELLERFARFLYCSLVVVHQEKRNYGSFESLMRSSEERATEKFNSLVNSSEPVKPVLAAQEHDLAGYTIDTLRTFPLVVAFVTAKPARFVDAPVLRMIGGFLFAQQEGRGDVRLHFDSPDDSDAGSMSPVTVVNTTEL